MLREGEMGGAVFVKFKPQANSSDDLHVYV